MSVDAVYIIKAYVQYLRTRGLTVYLEPTSVDPPDVGLRLSYSGVVAQGIDRERIILNGMLSGRGLDPGKYLHRVMTHSRELARLSERGIEYPLSDTLKAQAEIRLVSEGRFVKEESEDRFDWVFQAHYRLDLSYNPAVLAKLGAGEEES